MWTVFVYPQYIFIVVIQNNYINTRLDLVALIGYCVLKI